MSVNNKLREIRMREFLMEIREFADKLGVNLKTYSNWEKNRSKPPLEEALKIAEKLERNIEDIWYLEKDVN
ncbi:helix-turn-helix transcriptional regulator [Clostridium perfringens]|uniref:helix-turn-helix transcriptional regulator n=1 Tax=Clostridium perfringens TaxID=1502 RepID=UPI000F523AF2|nr:helix-turn-helix domain-containing protein [Clostridium perfringens]EGT4144077.1 helix-turn-helix domain-containing protein [Clostridium perfringens]MDK0734728.1 helix-turn-helix domain-containing protein [Clostridium perfringens]MEA5269345.1 helix-turn-helix domain-containing protein [Clostridium perfringens]MEA5309352.1 helix-turn-helix domain-containing protein [Clostridium perfringens]MEA5339825.1 helix-turn-helix domain-containing protein [Clostridium perfringens]